MFLEEQFSYVLWFMLLHKSLILRSYPSRISGMCNHPFCHLKMIIFAYTWITHFCHLLSRSLPLILGQAIVKYAYEQCLFFPSFFNASSFFIHSHILLAGDGPKCVWLPCLLLCCFAYSSILVGTYSIQKPSSVPRTICFLVNSILLHAAEQLVQGTLQLSVTPRTNRDDHWYPASECGNVSCCEGDIDRP